MLKQIITIIIAVSLLGNITPVMAAKNETTLEKVGRLTQFSGCLIGAWLAANSALTMFGRLRTTLANQGSFVTKLDADNAATVGAIATYFLGQKAFQYFSSPEENAENDSEKALRLAKFGAFTLGAWASLLLTFRNYEFFNCDYDVYEKSSFIVLVSAVGASVVAGLLGKNAYEYFSENTQKSTKKTQFIE